MSTKTKRRLWDPRGSQNICLIDKRRFLYDRRISCRYGLSVIARVYGGGIRMDVSGSCLCGKVTINLTELRKKSRFVIVVSARNLADRCLLLRHALRARWLFKERSGCDVTILLSGHSEDSAVNAARACSFTSKKHTPIFAAGLFGNLPENRRNLYKDQPHFYHFAEPTTRWQKLQNP